MPGEPLTTWNLNMELDINDSALRNCLSAVIKGYLSQDPVNTDRADK
jgi:hypothetical protein